MDLEIDEDHGVAVVVVVAVAVEMDVVRDVAVLEDAAQRVL